MWNLRILTLLAGMLLLGVVAAQACNETGWFGSDCQYKCRCGDGTQCHINGTCLDDITCQPRWFGPACQYADLAPNSTVTEVNEKSVVTDGDDNTCIPSAENVQNLTLTWNSPHNFTWMRIVVNETGSLDNITVGFKNASEMVYESCTNRAESVFNSRTLDIHCAMSLTADQVILSGPGIKALCSLYISGGRNIALRQNATQSTTAYPGEEIFEAYRAVDGFIWPASNNDGPSNAGKCASTKQAKGADLNPNWYVVLSPPQLVNRYVLYNTFTSYKTYLQGFTLTSYYQSNVVFMYTDEDESVQDVYTVLPEPSGQLVSHVQINGTMHGDRGMVNVCEVEIYIENKCETGKYGLECQDNCHCDKHNDVCFSNTGGCPEGCAPGFYEDGCQKECPAKFYGVNCLTPCSRNCLDQLCNRADGRCVSCIPGKSGAFCNEDCKPGSYGEGCKEKCNQTCGGDDNRCDGVNGTCSQGCDDGYLGQYCDETCPPMTYGQECLKNCSLNCKMNVTQPSVCHHVSGNCLLGCKPGFVTDDCSVESAEALDGQTEVPSPLIAGVAAAAAVLVIAIVVVAAVVVWRRRRRPKFRGQQAYQNDGVSEGSLSDLNVTKTENQNNVMAAPLPREPNSLEDAAKESGTAQQSEKEPYYNSFNQRGITLDIPVGELSAFMQSHPDEYFKDQFQQIPANNPGATTSAAIYPDNISKNRYRNILPYDHSRVLLKIDVSKNEGDYINASYVEGYKCEEKFIASQGPNKAILNDFVRMLWEQEVDKIVMLTNLIEEGKCKCERYWPEDDEEEFGDITIKLATTQVFADYTIRKLKLMKEGQQARLLTQFHFTSWPDKGVPTTPWGLVDFEQRIASYPTIKPTVVHCSAGVGRTGTFIALRNVLKEAEDTGHMNFFTTLSNMRKNRMNMIQTTDQYIFLHKAARVALVCVGTTVTSSNITERVNALAATSSTGQSKMAREFEAICNVCAEADDGADEKEESGDALYSVYQNSRSVTNKLKNRFSNVLSKDFYRPHLTCESKNMEIYINAVLLPSFTKQDHQILTQLPLPTTVVDFWRLVTQYQVSLIVAFEVDSSATDSTVGEYLPESEDTPITCEHFDIATGPATVGNSWEKRTLSVTENRKKRRLSVISKNHREEQQLTHLKCSSNDLSPRALLSLLKEVRYLSSRSKGRTLYMCRNGATYSGLVCVLSLLLDRMDNDLCLTVPLVVGAIKAIRPQVIPTLDQYKTLYETLKRYSETTAVYCNFGDNQDGQLIFKPMLSSQPKTTPSSQFQSTTSAAISPAQTSGESSSTSAPNTNPGDFVGDFIDESSNVYANSQVLISEI